MKPRNETEKHLFTLSKEPINKIVKSYEDIPFPE